MSILREVAAELYKMFIGDAGSTGAILAVVLLAGGLTVSGAAPPLAGGVVLLLGCIAVLVAGVVLSAGRRRSR
jgi:hypothetical protein